MGKKIMLFVFLVLLSSLLLDACSAGSIPSGTTSIQVTMTEFAFTPNAWTVPDAQKITLTLTNKSKVQHTWILMKGFVTPPYSSADQPNVIFSAQVAPGATNVVSFTSPSSAGEYEVVCGIPGHLEAGMSGKLTVVQP
jgi:uncharacterized cupredoxin-like copper-binding protein